MLSENSKQFVINHLRTCKECENYYNALNSNFLKDNEIEKNNDRIEIDHLKKVNKKITKLKWILTSIIILILILIGYFFFKTCYIDKINTITIDKGSYNGVEIDMVVVNSDGLIGKVVSTTTFTSDVKLLTTSDTNNKISVAISNGKNKLYGLIKDYNYKNNYLEVEGISNTESVSIGDYVYTSGLGGVFPSGILIGAVEEITTDEYDLAKIINVKLSANFDNINYVAILKRKEQTK